MPAAPADTRPADAPAALRRLLVAEASPAADEVLLDALAHGDDDERGRVVELMAERAARHPAAGAVLGAIRRFDRWPATVQKLLAARAGDWLPIVRAAGRAKDAGLRQAAVRFAAASGRAELAHVVAENAVGPGEALTAAAAEALARLADEVLADSPTDAARREAVESAVAEALRGRGALLNPKLARTALRLCGRADSKVLAVLDAPRHPGQTALSRRIQEPPQPGTAAATCLAAACHKLGGHFGVSVGQTIDSAAVADLARQSHRLKDRRLATAAGRTRRGTFREAGPLAEFLRHAPQLAPQAAAWVVACGGGGELLMTILERCGRSPEARRAVALACRQLAPDDARPPLLVLLDDDDPAVAGVAARELARAITDDVHGALMRRLARAQGPLRATLARLVGARGFDGLWGNYDKLDPATRRRAGRALLRLLPDGADHLRRKLDAAGANLPQRMKALRVCEELAATAALGPAVERLAGDVEPRVRSRAVALLGKGGVGGRAVMRALGDGDGRVRANAVDALRLRIVAGGPPRPGLAALLDGRASAEGSRERANAAAALCRLDAAAGARRVRQMLADARPGHRLSGVWAARQAGRPLLNDLAKLAEKEPDPAVRHAAARALRDGVRQAA